MVVESTSVEENGLNCISVGRGNNLWLNTTGRNMEMGRWDPGLWGCGSVV